MTAFLTEHYAAYYLLAGFIGGAVGIVEVFQRYLAEPLPALLNRWGFAYVVFNTLIAALVFYVVEITKLGEAAEQTVTEVDLLGWAFAAGFGGAAILRSKFLNVQIADGRDIALGPELVVQTFLSVIDRELDRVRANRRMETVRELMVDVDYHKAKLRLPIQLFQAMQGVTKQEEDAFFENLGVLDRAKSMDDQDKAYILGFYLLDLVGESFLRDIIRKYRKDFAAAGTSVPKSSAVIRDAMEWIKKEEKEKTLEPASPSPPPEPALNRDQVREVLRQSPPEGMTSEEIAASLKVEKADVDEILTKIRKEIKPQVDPETKVVRLRLKEAAPPEQDS